MAKKRLFKFGDQRKFPEETESRVYEVTRRGLEPPSSITVYFNCPFCAVEVKAFVWSLCGGGKRCECGAMFSSYGRAWRFIPK